MSGVGVARMAGIAAHRPRWADAAVAVGGVVLLYLVVRIGSDFGAPFDAAHAATSVSTDPARLPFYAACSVLRMFLGLGVSVLFTFTFATAAARLPRARKLLLPILDILQSVPILGFLSITVTGFIALFPGSQWGPECASIFAIVTSQAWNMAFSFYNSLVSQPRDLDEAARDLRLTRWQRFWRVDVPSSMIPLVWNGMMSFGGAWFFLVASEALTVDDKTYVVPGIGSYVAAATAQEDLGRVGLAIVAMVVMVVGVNAVFWRPLTAWAERFRTEDSASADAPRSVVLDVLRRSRVPDLFSAGMRPVVAAADRVTGIFGIAEYPLAGPTRARRAATATTTLVVAAALAAGAVEVVSFVGHTAGFGQVLHCLWLGLFTFGRVMVIVVVSTVVWVPVGVWIGLNPRVGRFAQPVVQVFASFPANFLFPPVTAILVATGVGLDWGGIVLMSLGAQWYILFNVIAGAGAIPTDLREAGRSLRLPRRLWWTRLALPAVFPYFVTGALTAAGGAWNASIVAEVVTYGSTTLTATGLGSYIAAATAHGDRGRILVGVVVMSAFVVGLNRLLWRPLYGLAHRRFSLS
ncbi:ABC transporter permease [Williamsia serinedens]|uniref:NitT/TauT family transport system permease protein n=1 Tax=Williamsia serinedens TaxID=391736 RepID=A0ABT1H2U5_9NOCA|nr:ABC transporter permease subunit [Williamsia serinedens]MCP2161540.1 NitT/TauT family transport system permease protein [Williamsia serinedens]